MFCGTACRFRAVWGTQSPASSGNKKHQSATGNRYCGKKLGHSRRQAASIGNSQQHREKPAVNRRVAGSNPARGANLSTTYGDGKNVSIHRAVWIIKKQAQFCESEDRVKKPEG
jgi:hypothetical protein